MRGSLIFTKASMYNNFLKTISEVGMFSMQMPVGFVEALLAITQQMATLPETKRLAALKAFSEKKDPGQLGTMAEFGARKCQLRPVEASIFKEYLKNNSDIIRQMNYFVQLKKFTEMRLV